MLKYIVVNWYGEITLKILRIKTHLGIPFMYPWDTKFLRNKNKIHFKRTFEIMVQF
jgi:hypothetical protein